MRYLVRHAEAGETVGMVIIACGTFRNTGDNHAIEREYLARFKEVFPQILENIMIDPDKVFMGGASGGAWRAYHYSAWVKHPWAGIYANVGWLGGRAYYDLPYPSGMRVAMVNGSLDNSNWTESDMKLLEDAGNTVALFSFEGGHQVAPYESQVKAFNWMLGRETVIELE